MKVWFDPDLRPLWISGQVSLQEGFWAQSWEEEAPDGNSLSGGIPLPGFNLINTYYRFSGTSGRIDGAAGGGVNFDNSDIALDIGGGIYGGLRTAVTPGDQWLGNNGKYYNKSWGGNQYTGSRSGAIAASNTYKWAGRATVFATVIIGGIQVYTGFQEDGGQFGYNANLAGASATGSIVGGWAGAEAGIYIGGSFGALFGGVGAVPGAIIGGFVGGIVGSLTGNMVGEIGVNSYYGR